MARFNPPGQCPVCGEWVYRGQAACEECGACAKSGWKAHADVYDGLDLPDEEDEFDYDDFVAREFGGEKKFKPPIPVFWWWVGIVLVIAMGWALLSGIF